MSCKPTVWSDGRPPLARIRAGIDPRQLADVPRATCNAHYCLPQHLRPAYTLCSPTAAKEMYTFDGRLLMALHYAPPEPGASSGRKPMLMEVDDSGDKLRISGPYQPPAGAQ